MSKYILGGGGRTCPTHVETISCLKPGFEIVKRSYGKYINIIMYEAHALTLVLVAYLPITMREDSNTPGIKETQSVLCKQASWPYLVYG